MAAEWLADDLWRAHVSWLTPPWVGNTDEGRAAFDAREWLNRIERAHYRSLIFYTKHHDGYCTFRSRYSRLQPERDFLGECVEEAHRRGVRVLAYYSSCLDQVSGREHAGWRVLGRDGNPAEGWFSNLWPGAYVCINNPDYRSLVLNQCAELLERYAVDGLWLDVFSPHTADNCFCRHCQALYGKQTGGASLLDTTGTEWYDSCFVTLMAEIRQLLLCRNPDGVVGYNAGPRLPGVDALVDFQTHEAVDAPTISLMCRAMRSSDKPFETTYRLYSAVGSWAIRGEDRVLLESMATASHGGACSIELSPTHTGRILDEAAERVETVGAYVRAREAYLVGTRPVYDAALFQQPSQYGWPRPAGWHTVFAERDIPFAILYPDADLSPYHLLVLDDAIAADERLAQRLAEHVRGGGSLIVEGEARRVALTAAKALACYRYEFAARASDRNILINLPPKATPSSDPAITLNRYGRGLAIYIACPLATGEIRAHRGTWQDAREYPMQLEANLARLALPEPLLAGTTPAGVEVVVNAQDGRHIVHLLNHYVSGQYYDNRPGTLKLADVPISINESRIGRVDRVFEVTRDGRRVTRHVRRAGGWAEVHLHELGAHGMVVFEG